MMEDNLHVDAVSDFSPIKVDELKACYLVNLRSARIKLTY